jgi:hypothetical protein
MQAVNTDRPVVRPHPYRYISLAIILAVLLAVGMYAKNAYQVSQPATLPHGTITISQSTLEAKYGLRVSLIAVTAAGGFVDLRLKIVDGEKAKLLLADAKGFPALFSDQGATLNAPAETTSQKIEFISGGNLFIMYPNSGNAVLQGRPVSILFGDIALEPIGAR